ncbi:porin, partial [Asaia spathodeae]
MAVILAATTAMQESAHAEIALFKTASNPWLQGINLSGLIEGGIMANPARPDNGINFG